MTTTDPFTEAARAEGQARIAAMLEVSGASDDIRAWFPAGFEKGAEWARARLAAQEPNRDEVLAAAWAICRLQDDGYEPTEGHPCGACTESARAALSAARAARRDEETSDEHR